MFTTKAQTYLLVMPPPGGRPGISSAARNLITYKRSGSSSLDLIIWMISVKAQSECSETRKQTRVPVFLFFSKVPSTFMSRCCSSSASCCSASCETWGAPGKQTMMMLMLSRLPCRGRHSHQRGGRKQNRGVVEGNYEHEGDLFTPILDSFCCNLCSLCRLNKIHGENSQLAYK